MGDHGAQMPASVQQSVQPPHSLSALQSAHAPALDERGTTATKVTPGAPRIAASWVSKQVSPSGAAALMRSRYSRASLLHSRGSVTRIAPGQGIVLARGSPP